ncbi:Fic family protein [Bradyrhizobium cenepequi]
MTAQRFDEPLPNGLLSVRHYRAVHRQLFQDVYAWAGKNRTLRISREGSAFCYPEYINGQLERTFGKLRRNGYLRNLSGDDFTTEAAEFLSELNAITRFAMATDGTACLYGSSCGQGGPPTAPRSPESRQLPSGHDQKFSWRQRSACPGIAEPR